MLDIFLTSNWSLNSADQSISGRELFRSLRQSGSIVLPRDPAIALIGATRNGYLGLLNFLVEEAHVDLSFYSQCSYILAVNNGHLKFIKFLLEKTVPKMEGLQKMCGCACSHDRLDIVEMLCKEFGVGMASVSGGFLENAVFSDNVEILAFVLSNGADASLIGDKHLHIAVSRRAAEMIEYLLTFPKVNPATQLHRFLHGPYVKHLEISDLFLRDPRVVADLSIDSVDLFLRSDTSGYAKLVLLDWMIKNMTYVNLSWIPVYKEFMLKYPQFAAQFQHVRHNAALQLRNIGRYRIACLIEVWSEALEKFAVWVSANQENSLIFADLSEVILCSVLPVKV